ncbi:hypothetical protein [Mesorhizobium sp. CAU 1732]|uniref:hypothetical protein n=1 Tax=Mesorhizobium sp. CAU 1732 TaxID=3140358 RepID=UPI003261C592
MARSLILISAFTAYAVLSASPIASATNSEVTLPQAQAVTPVQDTPALAANMLPMSMCGVRDQVVSELSQQFKETPMAVGQVDGNAVVEIFVSDGGSWTILATGTDGTSCIVSAGEGFESTSLVRGVDA